jgi:hypothetical protein
MMQNVFQKWSGIFDKFVQTSKNMFQKMFSICTRAKKAHQFVEYKNGFSPVRGEKIGSYFVFIKQQTAHQMSSDAACTASA